MRKYCPLVTASYYAEQQREVYTMKTEKLFTALLLMLPGLSWAPVVVPEPDVLPLLAAGGVIAVAVKLVRRKK